MSGDPVGQGTTVRVYVPRCSNGKDAQLEFAAGSVVGDMETVLPVEDDENVGRQPLRRGRDWGYFVRSAKDADDALVITESGAAIDLIFTEIVMLGTRPTSSGASCGRL